MTKEGAPVPGTRPRRADSRGVRALCEPGGLNAAERDALQRRALDVGVALDNGRLDRLAAFLGVLGQWATRANLVSIRDRDELLERHLVDSLVAAPLLSTLGPTLEIADLGSGAGFPGVPLAIVLEPARMLLVEARRKRASFLHAAARELPGLHFEIENRRLEDLVAGAGRRFDAIVSRAAMPPSSLVALGEKLLRVGGLLVAYRGPLRPRDAPAGPSDEPGGAAPLRREADVEYQLRGRRLPFHLEVWRRAAAEAV